MLIVPQLHVVIVAILINIDKKNGSIEIVRVAVISTVITIEKQKLKARSHPPPTLRDAKYNPSYTSTYSF